MDRRSFITGVAALGTFVGLPDVACAQSFPSKPIRIVGGFGPASTADVIVRLLAPHMQQKLGQPIIADSIQGAAGHIATGMVAKAAPDGHTLLMATSSQLGANPHLFPNERVDPTTMFEPVALVANIGLVVVAGPASPATTLPGVLDAAKRQPDRVRFGTPGVGTPMHLIGELLRERSGSQILHVPYKGGSQMASDVASGQIELGIVAYTPVAPFIQSGRLKPLAVCGTRRLAVLPDVPTVADLVPGVSMGAWCALVAPRGTPAPVCRQLGDAVALALAMKDVAARLVEIGTDRLGGSADTLRPMIKEEYELSGDLIRRLNIRLG